MDVGIEGISHHVCKLDAPGREVGNIEALRREYNGPFFPTGLQLAGAVVCRYYIVWSVEDGMCPVFMAQPPECLDLSHVDVVEKDNVWPCASG
jgi:hypothetical protein